jgi:hypothetical protein
MFRTDQSRQTPGNPVHPQRPDAAGGTSLPVGRRSLHTGAALAALLAVSACGGIGPEATEELGTAVQNVTPDPAGWRQWTSEPTNTGGWTGSPAACQALTPSGDGYVLIGRSASNNRYRIILRQFFTAPTSPADISTFTTFNTKPTCTSLDGLHQLDPSSWSNQIAVLGKSSANDQFQIKTLKLDTEPAFFGDPPSQPTTVVNWTSISANQYASAPAATVSQAALLVVGRRSDNRLYLHQNHLFILLPQTPFDNSTWDPVLQLPQLPSGWVAAGDPAIADTQPLIGVVTIVTRATRTGFAPRLYYTLFDSAASSFASWAQVPIAPSSVSVGSDPALEVDLGLGLASLYFRSGTNCSTSPCRVFQSSGIANLWGTFTQIFDNLPQRPDTFTEAPAALGNLQLEGHHIVTAKDSSNQFITNSTNVGIP